MSIATPKLKLPDSRETIALRAVEEVLKADPDLHRVVNKWATWRGEELDGLDPTYAMCPYVGLSPRPGASRWETEGQHAAPMIVVVTLAVVGTDVAQLMNLWGAVRAALFPQDPARWAVVGPILKGKGRIVKPTLTLGAFARSDDKDKKSNILVAKGFLEFLLHVNT